MKIVLSNSNIELQSVLLTNWQFSFQLVLKKLTNQSIVGVKNIQNINVAIFFLVITALRKGTGITHLYTL